MPKLIYSMNVSLDGFIARLDGDLDWVLVDEEFHRFVNDQTRQLSTEIYGRRLYEIMTGYWPTADQDPATPDHEAEFARIWREVPKLVFSRTLEQVDGNSRLATGELADEVAALKSSSAKDLSIGGADLAGQALRQGLVDEVRLFVQPVVLGAGKPMFPAFEESLDLQLVETHTFGSGVVYLRYERRASPDAGRPA